MYKYSNDQEIVGNTKTQENECPNCGSDDLVYDPQECVDANLIGQVCECKCCGFRFTNFFEMKYTGFAAQCIDFDENGKVM